MVLLLAPQPDAVEQPQVSDGRGRRRAGAGGHGAGREPLLLGPGDAAGAQPTTCPAERRRARWATGWRLDYARTEQTDEVDTWRVGVLSPDERRVDLEQAADPTEEWLTRADAGRPACRSRSRSAG